MEYIIANIKFHQCNNPLDNIYLRGLFEEDNTKIWIQEGFRIKEPQSNFTETQNQEYGIYNYIEINKESHLLIVKSDKRNTIPLYYYYHNKQFGLSNNPWLLAQLFNKDVEIDEASLISHLVYHTDIVPGRTIIKNLHQLKAGEELIFDFKNASLQIKSNYNFEYHPKENINIDEELQYADNQFTKYFEYIKSTNIDKVAGFGCSGGLDSRLIAHYTNKVGLDSKYFVIGDFNKKRLAQSVTSLVSEKVANVYKHSIKKISYSPEWLEDSLLLDIRNHPFFFSQIFLNPLRELPQYDYQISGDPGGVAYLGDAVISGDIELLKRHTDFFIGLRKDANIGLIDTVRKSLHHLGIPMNPYSETGLWGLNHSKIDYVIDRQLINRARKELFDVIDKAPGRNNIEKWFYIHDNITTRYMYASGYDSINRKKPSYFLYYPFFYEQIKHFPIKYLRNKYFLKKLLKYVNPDFSNIPDQNLNMMFKKQGIISKSYNRIELALRGRGLQILDMMRSRSYQELVKRVFSRKNPLFDKYVDSEKLKKSKLLYTYAGAQYLKLKMIVDIIYFKEFSSLIELKEFEIVS